MNRFFTDHLPFEILNYYPKEIVNGVQTIVQGLILTTILMVLGYTVYMIVSLKELL
jgi:hypothetical protein